MRRGAVAKKGWRGFGLAAAVAMVLAAFSAAPAQAAFGVDAFDGQVSADASGTAFTQAGGHPFAASATISFPTHPDPFGGALPEADARDLDVELPPGLIGNPNSVPTCSPALYFSSEVGGGTGTDCPVETQVGIASIEILSGLNFYSAVWNLPPAPGSPATFGMYFLGVRVLAEGRVRSGSDYGVTVRLHDINQGLPLLSTSMTLWGVPADPSHDSQRCALPVQTEPPSCTNENTPQQIFGPNSVGGSPVPFLSNPTACTPAGTGLTTNLTARSWQEPANVVRSSFVSHLPPGYPKLPTEWGPPQGPTGCERVPFEVDAEVKPTSSQAASPTGLDVHLHMPQDGLRDPGGLATSHLKRAVVSFPAGMSVNTATVSGLGTCAPAQIALDSPEPATCPDDSKIGKVQIDTPVLDHPIFGSAYLARQRDNKFDSLLAVYLAVDDPETGIVVKLPGKVETDAETGRLTAIFDDQPQLPFEDLHVEFFGGPRAPLVNPPSCGTYRTVAEMTPWSGTSPVTSDSSFEVTQGPNGKACPNGSFDPGFSAGTTNPIGGDYSPFQLDLHREDGSQLLRGLNLSLPPGLTGKLADIPYCPEAALGGIPSAEGTGAAQIANPSCPASSQVGSVSVAVGAGPNPFTVDTGKVYLAGPYRGAPLSLAVITPAVAGPFDLGNVLVRSALQVDPVTAQITATTDPLPTILHGVPLNLRDVRINLDRQRFTINPTSCDPMRFSGSATAAGGASAAIADRFQVASCERLGLKPKLAFKFTGAPTRRGGHPKLTATLTTGKDEANLRRVQVTLPKSEFLENAHIRTVCTRVQYAAKQCPEKSIYGYARAWTPLLDKPLEGPVYLRSSSHKLPDLVASLDGQIHIDLAGRIDSVKRRIRNTFETVPDAPVSKFQLTMQGGGKGLLVNNTNLCKIKPRAHVRFNGQNGKLYEANPLVKVGGCRGHHGKKRKHKHKHK